MNKSNVLIILGSYFPKPSPNGICAHQIAKEFKKSGNEVTVIANQSYGLSEYDKIDDINIYRIKGRWISRVLDWCRKNNTIFRKIVKKFIIILNKMQITIFLPLWPFLSPVYTYRLYKKALSLNKKCGYDYIISVYNPIDALIAGYLVKKKEPKIKLLLYYLDTLSGGITPRYFSRKWLENRGWFWEKRFFNLADAVFIMESHKKHYYCDTYKKYHNKINVVGIPLLHEINFEESNYNINFEKSRINFIYTGMLLKRLKNPEYMLTVFERLSSQIDCVFHIFGQGDCYDIIEKYRKRTNKDRIIEYGQVSVKDANNSLLSGDVLINIGSLVETQITGKIFEYVSTGKPIISFYKDSNEPSIPYLFRYPSALLIEENWENIDENCNKIIEFIRDLKGRTVEYDEVKKLYEANIPFYTVSKMMNI